MTKKTTRTRAEAKKLMWEYYKDNKETLPTWIRKHRVYVIEGLMEGDDPLAVFRSILRNVEKNTFRTNRIGQTEC